MSWRRPASGFCTTRALDRGASDRLGRGIQGVWRQAPAYSCSADALRKRVLRDGALPSIDPVVDLYNAISLAYALPVGGKTWPPMSGRPGWSLPMAAKPLIP